MTLLLFLISELRISHRTVRQLGLLYKRISSSMAKSVMTSLERELFLMKLCGRFKISCEIITGVSRRKLNRAKNTAFVAYLASVVLMLCSAQILSLKNRKLTKFGKSPANEFRESLESIFILMKDGRLCSGLLWQVRFMPRKYSDSLHRWVHNRRRCIKYMKL